MELFHKNSFSEVEGKETSLNQVEYLIGSTITSMELRKYLTFLCKCHMNSELCSGLSQQCGGHGFWSQYYLSINSKSNTSFVIFNILPNVSEPLCLFVTFTSSSSQKKHCCLPPCLSFCKMLFPLPEICQNFHLTSLLITASVLYVKAYT